MNALDQELDRLAALRRYCVLDTPREEAFDRITRLAATLFHVPIALISLVDEHRQWFKSRVGLDAEETPRNISFCAHAILTDEPFVIPNATGDPRFAQNPLVTGAPHIRFYAGAQIRSRNGHKLGTLCVIDRTPRESLSPAEQSVLRDLAGIASEELERRETARKIIEAERALAESQRRFFLFHEHSPAAAFLKDEKGRYLYLNAVAALPIGRSPQECLGKDMYDLWPLDEAEKIRQNDLQVMKSGQPIEFMETFRDRAGKVHHWLALKFPVAGGAPGGRLLGGTAIDITERERTKQELAASEERWQLALNGSNDGLWDWDAHTQETFRSARWKEMLGYSEAEIGTRGEEWENLIHPEDRPRVVENLNEHLERQTARYACEYRMRCKDGSYKWILARGQAVYDDSGMPLRLVGSHTDISERKKEEERLNSQAMTDPLTGLLNRRSFGERFAVLLKSADQGPLQPVLCVCDIDCFKSINDNYGHNAGDRVLIAFSELLRESVRDGELVARVGGDEFAILFAATAMQDVGARVERLRSQFHQLRFRHSRLPEFSASATFGYTRCDRRESEEMDEADEAFERADAALYQAKRSGRNCVVFGPRKPSFATPLGKLG